MPATPSVPAETGITEEGFLTDTWYLAAPSARLKPGAQERMIVLGEPVALGRTPAGEVFALRDICPHRRVPLSAGTQLETNGEWTLQCPYHGWRFGTDGGCRLMPSLSGDTPYDGAGVKVRRYPVHEANGAVYIYVAHDPRSLAAPPPPPPASLGPLPGKPGFVIEDVFNAHMDEAVIALTDPAYVPVLHEPRWRRPPSTGRKLLQEPVTPIEHGWAIERHITTDPVLRRWIFGANVRTQICFQLPGYRWDITCSETARLLTLTCATPEGQEKTRITQFTWWTGALMLRLAGPVAKRLGGGFLGKGARMTGLMNSPPAHRKAASGIDGIDVRAEFYHALKREWGAARARPRPFENPIQSRVMKWMS